MSLLGSYLPPPAPPPHPAQDHPPPFKKIRLSAERPPPLPHQTLRVDTREPVMNSYNTVEVDREMALSEATLSKLKKKQEELEQTASKPAAAQEPEEAPPRHRSLAQCIYADNRKRTSHTPCTTSPKIRSSTTRTSGNTNHLGKHCLIIYGPFEWKLKRKKMR
ncbi:unnamed protein product [Leptidea sinapis]|uniref:N-CoR GPS2-interacting domain-containing protein n=1 Tax=Leptidea sinapis TaxID=189913 RepID=A0A5E4QNP7_9NEOP|nr:unnamed protein product [Leptidea sinapis]